MILGLRRIQGNSMLPTFKNGKIVVVSSLLTPCVGQVAIARLVGEDVIKRIRAVTSDGKYYLEGDNHLESVDSREYGAVSPDQILGVVIFPRRK